MRLLRSFPIRWRLPLVALVAIQAALFALYWRTTTATVASWSRDPLAHGYLVVPLAIYLVWHRRRALEQLNPAISFAALPLVLGAASCWFFGELTGIRLAQQVGLTGMCFGLVWGILGRPVMRVLLFPLGLLLFAFPLGDRFVPGLQDLAARMAVKLLAFSGVPVLLQGHVIFIPQGEWQVAEACSGINYLTASLMIGYVYAGVCYRYWRHRVAFVLGSLIVPLFANALRVYATILVASIAGPQSIEGTKHFLFGWLVFAFMMALLFAMCGGWSEAPGRARSMTRPETTSARKANAWVFATAAVLIVSIAPISARLYLDDEHPFGRLAAPRTRVPWAAAQEDRIPWSPHLVGSAGEFVQTYEADGKFVKMYLAYGSQDGTQAKLSAVGRALFPDNWWTKSQTRRRVTLDGQEVTVLETELEGSSSSLLVWHWYSINGTFTDSGALLQFYLAKERLFRSPHVAAAMAVATENRPGISPGNVLQDFLVHMSMPD